MKRWSSLGKELAELLRLGSLPLAFRRCEKATELEAIPGVHRLKYHPIPCQILTLARTAGWTIGATLDELTPCVFSRAAGLAPTTSQVASSVQAPKDRWKMRAAVWASTLEDAEKWNHDIETLYTIPVSCEAVVVSPLTSGSIEPEVVIVYGTPGQMTVLMQGLLRAHYERLEFSFSGESSCVDSIHRCYITGKPALTIPCYGERWLGGVEENEMEIALPSALLETVIRGIKELSAFGVVYPVHRMASETNPWDTGLAHMYGPDGVKAREAGKSCWQ